MTDTDFGAHLERAFHEPAPGVDAAALQRAILGRVGRADRQRWLVLSAATALGLAIAGAAVFRSGLVALVRDGWYALGALELHVSGESSTWLFALVGLALLASSIVRAARDA
jgi:hypothetical protein